MRVCVVIQDDVGPYLEAVLNKLTSILNAISKVNNNRPRCFIWIGTHNYAALYGLDLFSVINTKNTIKFGVLNLMPVFFSCVELTYGRNCRFWSG